MSQENVEIVRALYEAANRQDNEYPFRFYADDVVWDLSNLRTAAFNPKPVYHGHEGVRDAWRNALSAFSEVHFEIEELFEAGDRVLAVIRESEVGRSSGVPVADVHLAVWTFADGKVTRMQAFDDRHEAFEAAGLPPRRE